MLGFMSGNIARTKINVDLKINFDQKTVVVPLLIFNFNLVVELGCPRNEKSGNSE